MLPGTRTNLADTRSLHVNVNANQNPAALRERRNGTLCGGRTRSSDAAEKLVPPTTKRLLSLLDVKKPKSAAHKKRPRTTNHLNVGNLNHITASKDVKLHVSSRPVPFSSTGSTTQSLSRTKNVLDIVSFADLPNQSIRIGRSTKENDSLLFKAKKSTQQPSQKNVPRPPRVADTGTSNQSDDLKITPSSIIIPSLSSVATATRLSYSNKTVNDQKTPRAFQSVMTSTAKTKSTLLAQESTGSTGLPDLLKNRYKVTSFSSRSRIADRTSSLLASDTGWADVSDHTTLKDQASAALDMNHQRISHAQIGQSLSQPISDLPSCNLQVFEQSLLSATSEFDFGSRGGKSQSVLPSIQEFPTMTNQSSNLCHTVKTKSSNDNFVRLNLKNAAGSCRGRRSHARHRTRKTNRRQVEPDARRDGSNEVPTQSSTLAIPQESFQSSTELMDPVDDFLDGLYNASSSYATNASLSLSKRKNRQQATDIPHCRVHNRPCKLCTVKKTANKGRQFWACSLPRDQQCQHFQWTEDSQQAAREALLKNQDVSGFVARQVASYMQGFANWTIPELRSFFDRKGITVSRTAKKVQLMTRVAIWVRDQVAIGVPETEKKRLELTALDAPVAYTDERKSSTSSTSDSSEDLDSVSTDSDSLSYDDELELVGTPKKAVTSEVNVMTSNCNHNIVTEDVVDNLSVESLPSDHNVSTCPIKSALKSLFGYSCFRSDQEWAIRRCLDNQRTIFIAPTGFGKSICYAIPAALKDGICVVVSPLLSLIQDQMRMLPPNLPTATLSGALTTSAMASTLDDIVKRRIKIVFVSPERLASPSFRRMFLSTWNPTTNLYDRKFPPVSLLCIDEAHCLSQWSHNFRPSYLRLRSIIDLIRPESILAMTATAGPRVVDDISEVLSLRRSDGVVSGSHDNNDDSIRILNTNRDNIEVSTFVLSSQAERLNALIALLSPAPRDCSSKAKTPQGWLRNGSVIVYVWRQRDAEVVAENIQASSVAGGVVVYHGGMKSGDREKAQNKFLRGKARICVATVAFGLGINKADIRGVIHMSLASSVEHFMQEIGRAGRDSLPSQAVTLLLADEVLVRHSLSHSDLISLRQTRAVFHYVHDAVVESLSLLPEDRSKSCSLIVGLPLSKIGVGTDCKPETVETLLSLLELSRTGESLVCVEGTSYDRITVAPKRMLLKDLAERETVARAILSCGICVEAPPGERLPMDQQHVPSDTEPKMTVNSCFGAYNFSAAHCANVLGPNAEPRHVFASLRRLEKSGEIDLFLDTSSTGKSLLLRVSPHGLCVLTSSGDERAQLLIEQIHNRFTCTVDATARKTLELHHIMIEVSKMSDINASEQSSMVSAKLDRFQKLVQRYFDSDSHSDLPFSSATLPNFTAMPTLSDLSSCVQSVLSYLISLESGQGIDWNERAIRLTDENSSDYTALVITKFLHGIATTVRVSHSTLRAHPLFGRMQDLHFRDLEAMVKKVL